jgi:hypothetical protein
MGAKRRIATRVHDTAAMPAAHAGCVGMGKAAFRAIAGPAGHTHAAVRWSGRAVGRVWGLS